MKKIFRDVEQGWFYSHERGIDYGINRSGGNLFFEKHDGISIIYSYGHHFPIAAVTPENVVIFTNRTHSSTTAKHIRQVKAAIPAGTTVIYTDEDVRDIARKDKDAVIREYDHHIKRIAGLQAAGLKMVNPARIECVILDIIRLRRECHELAVYSGIPLPAAVWDFLTDWTDTALRARIEKIIPTYEKIQAAADRRRQDNQNRWKREYEARNKPVEERIADFKTYSTNRIDHYGHYGVNAWLRVSQDGTRIQTSMQVKISAVNFKRYCEMLFPFMIGADTFLYPETHNFRIDGLYQVTRADTELVIVGCHKFSVADIFDVYEQLTGHRLSGMKVKAS